MVGTLLGWPLAVAEAADALREVEMGVVGEERRLRRGRHMLTCMHCLRLERSAGACAPEAALIPGTRARAARSSGFHGFSEGDAATGLGSPAGKG